MFEEVELGGAAGLGAVEVDEVDPMGAGLFEGLGGLDGVEVVVELTVVVALLKADDLAVAEVDAGDDLECHRGGQINARVRNDEGELLAT